MNDTNALDHLTRLASRSYSTSNCAAAISSDSWVPNTASSIISCATGTSAANANCSDLTAGGCTSRCFGFTQQLGTATNNDCATYNCTPSGNIVSQTDTRYQSTCTYPDLLQKINTNYDAVRQSNLNTLKSNLNQANGGLKSI